MNLYIECSKVLHKVHDKRGSVKKLVHSSDYDNKKQLYGLVCETLKYGGILQQILHNTKLLDKERLLKKDRLLAHALLHDFILTKGIVRGGRLKQTVTRNKTEIFNECERLITEAGVDTLQDLLPDSVTLSDKLPRYVRVNLLKTSLSAVVKQLKNDGWEQIDNKGLSNDSYIETVKELGEYQFIQDIHLYDVLVFPAGTDFHDNGMLAAGEIILQDKASCFPAHILSPPEGADVIDCCAAPGNKTSHIAGLMGNTGNIFAFDKDGRRMATLQYLTSRAGVDCVTGRCQDFLKVDPNEEKYAEVEYVLVDPSCSGSGIVSRMNEVTDDKMSVSKDRLRSLSNFQVTILKHVFKFPKVKRVVYSTCSVNAEENEAVVQEVIDQVSESFQICKVFPDWPERGQEGYPHSDCFLRMSPDTALTNGFFVACFERKVDQETEIDHTDSFCCEESYQQGEKKVKKKKKKRKSDKEKTNNLVMSDENDNSLSVEQCPGKKHRKDKVDESKLDKVIESQDSNHKVTESKHSRKKHKKSKRQERTCEEKNDSEHSRKKHKKSKHEESSCEEKNDSEHSSKKCKKSKHEESSCEEKNDSEHSRKKHKKSKHEESSCEEKNDSEHSRKKHKKSKHEESSCEEKKDSEHSRKKHKKSKHEERSCDEKNDLECSRKKHKKSKHEESSCDEKNDLEECESHVKSHKRRHRESGDYTATEEENSEHRSKKKKKRDRS